MKNQALFSSKDESKKLKCRLLQFLFGALRVKAHPYSHSNDKDEIQHYGQYISPVCESCCSHGNR